MAKFSTIALSAAGLATVVVVGLAASAGASSLPMITSSSSSSSSTTSSPPAETTAPAPAPNAITADIHVELGFLEDSGPKTFDVYGVVVGDGIELIDAIPSANPSEHPGDVTVDISLNPATITVTGGEDYGYFQEAYVKVTLHGAEFSSTTLLADGLFDINFPDKADAGAGSYKSRGLHYGLDDPYPVLDSYGVSGSVFSAYWLGGDPSDMSGEARFGWVPAANAAVGAGGLPAFTG